MQPADRRKPLWERPETRNAESWNSRRRALTGLSAIFVAEKLAPRKQPSSNKLARELTDLKSLSIGFTEITDLTPLVEMKHVTIYSEQWRQERAPVQLKDRMVAMPTSADL